MSLPKDFFETNDWKLVLRPVWIRKNEETVEVPCVSCRDLVEEQDCVGFGNSKNCNKCNGTGFVKTLKEIDSPLPFDNPKYKLFLDKLQEFIDNYDES